VHFNFHAQAANESFTPLRTTAHKRDAFIRKYGALLFYRVRDNFINVSDKD
jgi:GTP cyclohydrolase III